MKICENCNKSFPTYIKINGKWKHLHGRRFCLECSPYRKHNTRKNIISPSNYKNNKIVSKACGHCKQMLPISDYYKNTKSYHSLCKKCFGILTIKRQRKLKRQAVEYKGNKCSICGYSKCDASLEFHHLDPLQKEFAISSKSTFTFEYIKKELDKCILLCKNCHGEAHYNK